MGYIASYKRLEKLCSEIYSDNHGLSAYINEMLAFYDGSLYVPDWNEDLRKLKHYRWVRNKIVHEPDCSEESMCTPEDEQWLEGFRLRIMSGTDPLAMYRKAKSKKRALRNKPKSSEPTIDYTYFEDKDPPKEKKGCLSFILSLLFGTAAAIVIIYLIMEFV